MGLPVPDLDDRRFQDLVDEAKRFVQQRNPAWTDHNVHDPGVTLIELFAWMTEQVVYRLNRVPDKLHLTFLDLLGVHQHPPTAARVEQTFWLSAAQDVPVTVPEGTEVATARQPGAEPVVFTTTTTLEVVPVRLLNARTAFGDGGTGQRTGQASGTDHREAILTDVPFPAFSLVPVPGDALLVALTEAAPGCAVQLDVRCSIDGIGVDPDDPPLLWEAWAGRGWDRCEVDVDTTGGLNKDGRLVVHVPAGHVASLVNGQRGGWLRARVTELRDAQTGYSASPMLRALTASAVGGTAPAVHAATIRNEVVGESLGVSGQAWSVALTPVVPGDHPFVVETSDPEDARLGWLPWQLVDDFSASTGEDRHVTLEPMTGTVRFGPAVREQDGTLTRYGAVPPVHAAVRVREYRTGGGQQGDVSAGGLTVLRTPVPFVGATTNRLAARGGRDGETVENARTRGPLVLRARGRAVTAEDYERLAMDAAREAARVKAVTAAEPGGVRVLVVPSVVSEDGRLAFGSLVPAAVTLQRIAEALELRRVLGARVVVEPPTYQGVTVVARLRCAPLVDPQAVQATALRALYRRLNPVDGGPDGTGWPFGRTVHVGEVYATLARLPGVDLVEDARLFPADPVTGRRGEAAQRIDLEPTALVFSHEHQVLVTASS